MRKALITLTVIVALICLCGLVYAATWSYMLEGAVIPGPYYFQTQTTESYVNTSIIDTATMNRAISIVDESTSVKAQIVRPNYHSENSGVTVHMRFQVGANSTSNAVGIQIPDNYMIGSETRGHVKWSWSNNQMTVSKGTPDGVGSFSVPADTWVEIWITLVDNQFKLWVKNGSTWTLTNQGTLRTGGVAAYIGSGDNAGKGSMLVDFFRFCNFGAFEPTDPNVPTLPLPTNSIGESKAWYPIGYPVDLQGKVVTNSWVEIGPVIYNIVYIQESNRSAGLRVRREVQSYEDKLVLGSTVNLRGYCDIADKEVFAVADDLSATPPAPESSLPDPVLIAGKNIGIGVLGLQEAYTDTLSSGLNNVGLRVRISGYVTASGAIDLEKNMFISYVDDRVTNIPNDSLYWYLPTTGVPYPGFKVYTTDALTEGNYVAVSGNVGIEKNIIDNSIFYPVIYSAQPSDVNEL